jgi:hypothetical protein
MKKKFEKRQALTNAISLGRNLEMGEQSEDAELRAGKIIDRIG